MASPPQQQQKKGISRFLNNNNNTNNNDGGHYDRASSVSDLEHSVDDSQNIHATIEPDRLQSAYERQQLERQQANQRRNEAEKLWIRRVLIWCCLLLITSTILLISPVWYINILGITAASTGIHGARKKKSEFVFVTLILLSLEIIKNIGFLIYIGQNTNLNHTQNKLLLSCALIEEFLLIPPSFYCSFYLYRTLNIPTNDINTNSNSNMTYI
jgi:hypothetical protein